MGQDTSDDSAARGEKALRRCLELSRLGRYRKVVTEVDKHIDHLDELPQFQAALLVWKAQALLTMGHAEKALPFASQSWDLEPSPHACHLTSNALEALGDLEGSEELLRMGWRLFPEAVHLPVQLAVTLSDQARHPEALQILEEVPLDDRIPDDLQVFLFGIRSNLLAAMGRWAEAEEVLRDGKGCYPESQLLEDAHSALIGQKERNRAEKALISSWTDGVENLEGGAADVDDSVIRCGAVNEVPELVTLGARRLWRAYLENRNARPRVPDVWGAALILAILEMDGNEVFISAIARSVGCKPSSVGSVFSRLRAFLASLDREFAARAFAAETNPRLTGTPSPRRRGIPSADVVPFPKG